MPGVVQDYANRSVWLHGTFHQKSKRLPPDSGSLLTYPCAGQAAEVTSAGFWPAGYTLTLYRVLLLCSNFTTPSISA